MKNIPKARKKIKPLTPRVKQQIVIYYSMADSPQETK